MMMKLEADLKDLQRSKPSKYRDEQVPELRFIVLDDMHDKHNK